MSADTPERDMLAEAVAKGPLPGVPTPEEDEELAVEAAQDRSDTLKAEAEQETETTERFGLRIDE